MTEEAKTEAEVDFDDMSDADLDALLDPKEEDGGEEAEVKGKAAEEAAEGEDDASEGDEDAEDGDKSDSVPHGRFHQERERRKSVEYELGEANQRLTQMEGRFSHLLQAMNRPPEQKQEAPEFPDEESDPLGYLKAKNEYLEKQLGEFNTNFQRQQEAQQQEVQRAQVISGLEGAAQQYAERERADFWDAYNHMTGVWANSLQAQGVTNPMQLRRSIEDYAVQFARGVAQQGGNPFAVLYDQAKAYGYRPNEAGSADTKPAVSKEAQEKIDREAKRSQAQDKALSLGKAGRSGDPVSVDMESLVTMSDEEFAKFADNAANWAKVNGVGMQ